MRTILVVDDSRFIRLTLKKILEKGFYKVIGEAATGREAIEKYKAYPADVVILDITLPDMSGLEVLR